MIVTSVIRALVYNFLSLQRARTLTRGSKRFKKELPSWYMMLKLFEHYAFNESMIAGILENEEVRCA